MALPVNISELIHGKATGIPVIRNSMKANGSPEPSFYTDKEKTLFLVTLPCHVDWSVSKTVTKPVSKSVSMLVSMSVSKMSLEIVTERHINHIGIQAIALLSNKKSDRLKMEIRSTSVTKILGIPVTKTLNDSVSKIVSMIWKKNYYVETLTPWTETLTPNLDTFGANLDTSAIKMDTSVANVDTSVANVDTYGSNMDTLLQ